MSYPNETAEEQMARIRRDEWRMGDVGFLLERITALEAEKKGGTYFTVENLKHLVDLIRHDTQRNVAQLYFLAGLSQVPAPVANDGEFGMLVSQLVRDHNDKVRGNGYESALYEVEQAFMPTNAALPDAHARYKQIKARLLPKLEWHDRDVWNKAIEAATDALGGLVGLTTGQLDRLRAARRS